ncbi:GntR family transcriptional regulator [Streptomyces sp. 4F14]|uniref:GntR family transcriptional regulator n=1 Tax=Streptomyces sp. 4F14 TaxID=3394380 RepID=UPI003A844BCA
MNAVDEENPDFTWQKHLNGIRALGKGVHLKGEEGEKAREAIRKAYSSGGSIRGIADYVGRSFGYVHRALDASSAIFRPHGGSRPAQKILASGADRVERILRDHITDGTYEVHHRLPSFNVLAKEIRMTWKTFETAVQKLATDHLLLQFPRRGYVVTDPADLPKGDTLQVCIQPGRWERWLIGEPGVSNDEHLKKIIIELIEKGDWRDGHKIPTRWEIGLRFGATENTVRLALCSLEKDGRLVRSGRSLSVQNPDWKPQPEQAEEPPSKSTDTARTSGTVSAQDRP